jgi:hypothetical protein
MRATDIIRGVLDLIDQVDCAQQEQPADPIGGAFAQLFAQMTTPVAEPQRYDNSPNVRVQGIDSVTTAAGLGGLNGAKNPADIRSDSVSMFPAYQAGVK